MADVLIDADMLSRLYGSLTSIVLGLEDSAAGRDRLSDFVGAPEGDTALSDAFRHFEDGWDERRAHLIETLTRIRTAIEETCESWDDFDAQSAASLKW